MSKKRKNNRADSENIAEELEESYSLPSDEKEKKKAESIIDELFGDLGAQTEIEEDIADLGSEEDSEAVTENPVKHRFYFGFAIFVVIMAIIGLISSVRFIISGIGSLMDNASLKEEFTKLLLPVVANDVAPFNSEKEISHSAKVSCSIWNILLYHDISAYKKTPDGELIIPEYDVGVSCKELFGTSSEIVHQSTGSTDTRFIYDAENHFYTCTDNMRYLSYAPGISEMSQSAGVYTLTVDYFPPSISVVSQNVGIESVPEKTMVYTIWRDNGKNTLLTLKEANKETE